MEAVLRKREYKMDKSEWKKLAKHKLSHISDAFGKTKGCLKPKLRYCTANFQKSATKEAA